jgi:zinc protease
MNRANSLAFYELLGDASLMNTELDRYNAVTVEDIQQEALKIFREENSSTLYYRTKL